MSRAPSVSSELIEALIVLESYFTADQATAGQPQTPAFAGMTFCLLTLKNGYVVVGKSAVVSAANFDAALGRSIAREDAKKQIWALEGYAMLNKIAGV